MYVNENLMPIDTNIFNYLSNKENEFPGLKK